MVDKHRAARVRFTRNVRHCPRCSQDKSEPDFGHRRKDGPPQSWCRTCMAAYMREHRKKQRAIVEVAVALAEKLITPRMRGRLIDDLIWKGHVNVKIRAKQAVEELRRSYNGQETT